MCGVKLWHKITRKQLEEGRAFSNTRKKVRNKQYVSVFLIRLLAIAHDCITISSDFSLRRKIIKYMQAVLDEPKPDLKDLFNSLNSRKKTLQGLSRSNFPNSVQSRIPLDKI